MNKRRRLIGLVLAMAVGLSLLGCEEEEPEQAEPPEQQDEVAEEAVEEEAEEPDQEEPQLAEPSEQSAELIAAIDGYQQWSRHEGVEEPYESGHPGDVWVLPYANEIGIQAVEAQELPISQGAIFVKEEYADSDGGELTGVTVMEKLSQEMGDWYWLKVDPDLEGVMQMEGMALEGPEVAGCVNCHGESAQQDFLMLSEFDESQ